MKNRFIDSAIDKSRIAQRVVNFWQWLNTAEEIKQPLSDDELRTMFRPYLARALEVDENDPLLKNEFAELWFQGRICIERCLKEIAGLKSLLNEGKPGRHKDIRAYLQKRIPLLQKPLKELIEDANREGIQLTRSNLKEELIDILASQKKFAKMLKESQNAMDLLKAKVAYLIYFRQVIDSLARIRLIKSGNTLHEARTADIGIDEQSIDEAASFSREMLEDSAKAAELEELLAKPQEAAEEEQPPQVEAAREDSAGEEHYFIEEPAEDFELGCIDTVTGEWNLILYILEEIEAALNTMSKFALRVLKTETVRKNLDDIRKPATPPSKTVNLTQTVQMMKTAVPKTEQSQATPPPSGSRQPLPAATTPPSQKKMPPPVSGKDPGDLICHADAAMKNLLKCKYDQQCGAKGKAMVYHQNAEIATCKIPSFLMRGADIKQIDINRFCAMYDMGIKISPRIASREINPEKIPLLMHDIATLLNMALEQNRIQKGGIGIFITGAVRSAVKRKRKYG